MCRAPIERGGGVGGSGGGGGGGDGGGVGPRPRGENGGGAFGESGGMGFDRRTRDANDLAFLLRRMTFFHPGHRDVFNRVPREPPTFNNFFPQAQPAQTSQLPVASS